MTDPAPDSSPRKRGRPRRDPADAEARQRLIRSGLVHLTERGYSASGVDEILRHAGVPKGSFYHYFASKEAFGLALIDAYGAYFATLLDRSLGERSLPPLERLRAFTRQAEQGMARHNFRRGCLVGNLGQEMSALPESFRVRLIETLADWQTRTAACLSEAKNQGALPAGADPQALAAFFWTGWEGAILRAKLEADPTPLRLFAELFLTSLSKEPAR
ncbi:TetR/AcrR family transcriptional regulator [Pararhodobacter sp. CCB-MM2]|uniref:acrylate utilization transcriptional regulator AcuR n=1 Tax=Pararhodobacter sp. CCB-MM2 TaxID=1786003 RepID=UPI000831417E|nr:TetR/AcrR family transcriptional regulator [Pararhodobacter sp. CCB-MM2]